MLISSHCLRRPSAALGEASPLPRSISVISYQTTPQETPMTFYSLSQYLHYNMKKEQELVDNGRKYHVKPKRLYFDNNCYYLLALESEQIQSYRVDKMTNVNIVDQESFRWTYMRTDEIIQKRNEKEIQILFSQDSMDTVIDRFGEDIKTRVIDEATFSAKVSVVPSSTFFGWVMQYKGGILIEKPAEVKKNYEKLLTEIMAKQQSL